MITVLLLFSPTILLLLSLPLWKVKKISNEFLYIYLTVVSIGIPILFIFEVKNSYGGHEWAGGVGYAIIIMALNGYQTYIYMKKLNNKRCPFCHKLTLHLEKTVVNTYRKNYITQYKYENKKGIFQEVVSNIKKYTTYHLCCSECNQKFQWTDTKEETLSSGERQI